MKLIQLPFHKILVIFLVVVFFSSCTAKKDIVYFQDFDKYNEKNVTFNEQKIQPNDILKIEVGSVISEAAIPYNKPVAAGALATTDINSMRLNGYMVSIDSQIDFPVLGKINVKDFTVNDLEMHIKKLLIGGKHMENPSVSVRILNTKVTVLGEVNSPGTFNITEPRMTILQVLGLAGDLTISGKRNDLLLIREIDGKRKTIHLDLTSIELIDSPYYQMQANDVLVVQPNYAKIKSAGFVGSPGTLVSIASFILSFTILITR